ncbi:conserved hypothetical protein [Talaromyces stipitatus ATCC 10500]|uniref:AB hydrolase-1 domain-containing protein n=1 Tax=Talaromyces stipitatus (strain ATCC 10500 / CBS 375.48 / QM 6759 / NRRL 1006) TaxID=441959 RepID=B8MB11_TALSN|nr:uncharacterized protein TSTA_124360 [Talaromyces stipitatus ATCC 10500]EED18712.1 conserved hypothetical protein [Talaromyces stipitatus ATCC 10500]
MSKPTLIFCPGAWSPPTAFNPLIEKLPEYTSQTIAFPSVHQATTIKDLKPDIEALRNVVQSECDQGHEVAIISHSWSGLPVSSALDESSRTERQKIGTKGGVVKLIYISAFIPEIGQSLLQTQGGVPPDWYIRDEMNNTVLSSDPYTLFFHDVPNGQEWAQTLRPHAWASMNSPTTSASYLEIPCAYLLCENDRAIPLSVQEAMVERARSKGAVITTEKVKTGHTPWLVVPDEVAAFVNRQIE